MRKLGIMAALVVVVIFGWYIAWRSMMAGDVARVRATLAYQQQQFKTAAPYMTLKADDVRASGFPFHFRVKVVHPELSEIFNKETYAISFPEVVLEPTDSDQGRYRVSAPRTFHALYAADGQAPEQYTVTPNVMPGLALRAQGDSQRCSDFPGAGRCAAVAGDAPLISYAVQVPASITLHMELNGESRDANFALMALNVPVFQAIPANMDGPLTLFVGILRQALVLQGK